MPRYFTYVSPLRTLQQHSWGSGTYRKTYLNQEDRQLQNGVGLYFEDTEQPLAVEALQGVVQDPTIQSLFGETPYVLKYHNGYVVTNDGRFHPQLPDQPGEKLVHIGTPNKIVTVDLDQRYRDCNHIVKMALGCADCPDKGPVCISRGSGLGVTNGARTVLTDHDELEAAVKKWNGAGMFQLVSPHHTRSTEFQASFRHPEEHDFARIKTWKRDLSERAKIGAENRKFRKEQCGVCPLQYSCGDYRRCKGPYPKEEEFTKKALATWLPRVKDKTKNPFKRWQFWALAHINNIEIVWNPHKRGFRPRKTNLCGLEWDHKKGWYVRGEYTRWASTAFETTDYNWLCALFPQLPKTKEDADKKRVSTPTLNRKALAMWLQLFEQPHGTRRSHGFGGGRHHSINGRIMLANKALVCFAWSDRYAAPGFSRELTNWRDFWSEVSHTLPVGKMTIRY